MRSLGEGRSYNGRPTGPFAPGPILVPTAAQAAAEGMLRPGRALTPLLEYRVGVNCASRTVTASRRGRGQLTSPTKRQPKSLPNAHSRITRFTFMAALPAVRILHQRMVRADATGGQKAFWRTVYDSGVPVVANGAAGSDSALRRMLPTVRARIGRELEANSLM